MRNFNQFRWNKIKGHKADHTALKNIGCSCAFVLMQMRNFKTILTGKIDTRLLEENQKTPD